MAGAGSRAQQPWSQCRSQGLYQPSAISSLSVFKCPAIFCLQTSYKLGFQWLFTLYIRRLSRCSSWVLGSRLHSLLPHCHLPILVLKSKIQGLRDQGWCPRNLSPHKVEIFCHRQNVLGTNHWKKCICRQVSENSSTCTTH